MQQQHPKKVSVLLGGYSEVSSLGMCTHSAQCRQQDVVTSLVAVLVDVVGLNALLEQ